MSPHGLLTLAFALSMGLVWIGIPVAVVSCNRRGNKDLGELIALGLLALGVAGAILTSTSMKKADARQDAANVRVVLADEQIRQVLSASRSVQEDTGLRAREPYIALKLSREGELTSIGCISGKRVYDVLTPADVASIRTICLAVDDGQETATYTDQYGRSRGEGTAEHRLCTLYDVESGTFFLSAPLRRTLPEKLSGSVDIPRLMLKEEDYKGFIVDAMR